MKALKNGLQTLIFILLIVALGGYLLPSVQKVEKAIIIKAKPETVFVALNKSLDSLGVKVKDLSQFSFTSKNGDNILTNRVSVKPAKEGSELIWVQELNVGNDIFKKYSNLVNRNIEEGKLKEQMILIKMNSEKK